MPDRRRDNRIDVQMTFLLTDPESKTEWRCKTLDMSPTGILFEVETGQGPPIGTMVNVLVRGPAQDDWAHINMRTMRVVRIGENQTGLEYA
ncbi:MAG: PilZ domain-containing protein [Gammaproteobacteria bacterium]|nr:PilZ domain-containing protein [Gammaproteobacteria bacterium]MDH3768480.1 PilZ domain-containing protein [Gammaproteobacteria bacterium]